MPSRLSSHYYGAAAINEMESGCHSLLLLTEIVGYHFFLSEGIPISVLIYSCDEIKTVHHVLQSVPMRSVFVPKDYISYKNVEKKLLTVLIINQKRNLNDISNI